MARPRYGFKTCDHCGRTYYRRNTVEVWDQRNPGHRAGWRKTIVRVCMDCESEATARRMLMFVGVEITKVGTVKPVKPARGGAVRALPPRTEEPPR